VRLPLEDKDSDLAVLRILELGGEAVSERKFERGHRDHFIETGYSTYCYPVVKLGGPIDAGLRAFKTSPSGFSIQVRSPYGGNGTPRGKRDFIAAATLGKEQVAELRDFLTHILENW
jgi:hypothetical protein